MSACHPQTECLYGGRHAICGPRSPLVCARGVPRLSGSRTFMGRKIGRSSRGNATHCGTDCGCDCPQSGPILDRARLLCPEPGRQRRRRLEICGLAEDIAKVFRSPVLRCVAWHKGQNIRFDGVITAWLFQRPEPTVSCLLQKIPVHSMSLTH